MTEHVVIDHHHDEEQGVYRLVVGVPVTAEQPVTDSEGALVADDEGTPATETVVVGYTDTHEVVWADDDERWHSDGRRRSAGKVAEEQRREVAERLAELDSSARERRAAARAGRKPMPGAGGPLAA